MKNSDLNKDTHEEEIFDPQHEPDQVKPRYGFDGTFRKHLGDST